MNPARLSRRALLATAAAAMLPARAAVERFPGHAVRLVVPYSTGIGPDVVARALADELAAPWRQPVVVDNKPGASGIVAFSELRRTPPDGHTLFLADTATLAVNPLLHASLPYDPVQDIAPLSLLFRATFVLWTARSSRWGRLDTLLDAARREPGRLSYASLGNGHASQVAIESFARAAGIRLLHVPFKDNGALLAALAAGEVDLYACSVNTAAGLYAGGRLRPLAVAARARLGANPEIPTLTEAGGPAVEMHPWAGIVTVAGTPAPRLARLQQDLRTALAAPRLRARAAEAGFEITPSAPDELRARAEADRALYAPLLADGRVVRL
ncbi:Bug family tripartite tricarboxylate transporter substrate binding protein [Rubrivivax gelatinosus]|uniref:Tripartite-type tricarboxylate transporter receptor subunit TctC n=1 Tax=Rubrivivax gelatinosus TaxID=28068 RepID=A0ABS1DR88_RUBGE|nr:tripartite tricarboxylate transporter substrate binding protein [Rubrivivax gelatinosus]MBK1712476.1 hypothetical protein [Rubrivivax gelatinosus]